MGKIKVDNKEQEVTFPLSLTELIKINRIVQPDMVSVQLNGELLERERFTDTILQEGDTVDFLYFMGGGR